MKEQLTEWFELFTSLEFWEEALASFQALGPFVPIALAALESLIPALPLVAIVTMNVAAHGTVLGFVYSWIGTCVGCTIVFSFFRRVVKPLFDRWGARNAKVEKARAWVQRFDRRALFILLCLPFTPSSFVNIAFAVTDFNPRAYLTTVYKAKSIMIGLLALLGQSCVQAMRNPWFLLLAGGLLVGLYFLSKKLSKKHGL